MIIATVNPTGGDVIERNRILFHSFASLKEARKWGIKWYRPGPNGPVRYAMYFHISDPCGSLVWDRYGWPVGATLIEPGHPLWLGSEPDS